MLKQCLGTIEVIGLTAALEAADTACKAADVTLLGYEATDGMGMVAVKVLGQVGAVKAAIDAARFAAGKVNKVVSTSVIPRPNEQIEPIIRTAVTVGQGAPTSVNPDDPGSKPASIGHFRRRPAATAVAQPVVAQAVVEAPAPVAPPAEPAAEPPAPAKPASKAVTLEPAPQPPAPPAPVEEAPEPPRPARTPKSGSKPAKPASLKPVEPEDKPGPK